MNLQIGYMIRFLVILLVISQSGCAALRETPHVPYDVVVYGGTSSGVIAAAHAAHMGKSVILVEPGQHLGGFTSGGLGATAIGNRNSIGGMAKDFYHRVYLHYKKDNAWVHEKRRQYVPGWGRDLKKWDMEEAWWMFEPQVAEMIFKDMIREAKVDVVYGERLELNNGLQKKGSRILSITMESGRVFRGKIFIDATYEGDLMAKAGVSYFVGRESNSRYGETLNGVQKARAIYHQFIKPVDPYIRPGDPSSGVLPGINSGDPGRDGQGDRRLQAYNFRICMTDVPENRVPFPKPKDYDPLMYELLLRNFEAGDHRIPIAICMMPNRKTDLNNKYAISTDYIGMNYK